MSPTLPVVVVVKVQKEKWVLKIQKCISPVQIRVLVHYQVLQLKSTFKLFVDFSRQFLLVVLVRYVAQHHVGALIFATLNHTDSLCIDDLVRMLTLALRLARA